MADDPPRMNLLDTILATQMNRMAQAHRQARELNNFLEHGADADYDQSVLQRLLLASINGGTDLKAQRVEESYLMNDQKLFIPIGLGINPQPAGASRAPRIPWLLDRYWRATTLTFGKVHTWFINCTPFADIRAHVDGLAFPEQRVVPQDWTIDAPADMQIHEIDNVFARLSKALQLNYDIRDTGILNNVDMSVADNAWVDISTVTIDRIRQKLKAFSLQSIAALNYEACAKHATSAWARAYGEVVNGIYAEAIKNIAEEVITIKNTAPSYSVLYYLYGIDKQARVSAVAADAVEMMMPIVYGYAEVAHTDEQGNKEGIALALSRLNVGCRKVVAAGHTWAVIWRVYLEKMDTAECILKFTKCYGN